MTGKLAKIQTILDSRMPEWGVLLLDETYHRIGFFLEDEVWPPWARYAILHPEVVDRLGTCPTDGPSAIIASYATPVMVNLVR